MLTVRRRVKILDFGLAKLVHGRSDRDSEGLTSSQADVERGRARARPVTCRGAGARATASSIAGHLDLGREVDEMLTGKRASKATRAWRLNEILKHDRGDRAIETSARCQRRSSATRRLTRERPASALQSRATRDGARNTLLRDAPWLPRSTARRRKLGGRRDGGAPDRGGARWTGGRGLGWTRRLSAARRATRVRSMASCRCADLSGDAVEDDFAEGITEALIDDLAKAARCA